MSADRMTKDALRNAALHNAVKEMLAAQDDRPPRWLHVDEPAWQRYRDRNDAAYKAVRAALALGEAPEPVTPPIMAVTDRPPEPSIPADKSPRAFREIGEALTRTCSVTAAQAPLESVAQEPHNPPVYRWRARDWGPNGHWVHCENAPLIHDDDKDKLEVQGPFSLIPAEQQAPEPVAQMIAAADEIVGEIDRQTYDERRREDLPDDAELTVTLRLGLIRAFEKSVAIAQRPAQQAPEPVAQTPAAKWRENGEPDPHGSRYNGERAQLACGHMTDDEYMSGRANCAEDCAAAIRALATPREGEGMSVPKCVRCGSESGIHCPMCRARPAQLACTGCGTTTGVHRFDCFVPERDVEQISTVTPTAEAVPRSGVMGPVVTPDSPARIKRLAVQAKVPKFMYDTDDCRAALVRFANAYLTARSAEAGTPGGRQALDDGETCAVCGGSGTMSHDGSRCLSCRCRSTTGDRE